MARAQKQKKVKGKNRPQRVTTQDLILYPHSVDKLRRAHIQSYRQQLDAVQKSRAILKNFEDVEMENFKRWSMTNFGPEMEKEARARAKLEKAEKLTQAIEYFRSVKGGTFHAAYKKVMIAQDEDRLDDLLFGLVSGRDEPAEASDDDFAEFFQRLVNEEKDKAAQNEKQASEPKSYQPFESIRAEAPEEVKTRHLKAIYHELVKVLHPDVQGGEHQNPEHKVQWDRLQKAYDERDLQTLEDLRAQVSGETHKPLDLNTVPIGEILTLKEAAKQDLAALRDEIASAKGHAAWDFSNRLKNKSFVKLVKKKLREEFQDEIHLLELLTQDLEATLQKWSVPARQGKSARTEPRIHGRKASR